MALMTFVSALLLPAAQAFVSPLRRSALLQPTVASRWPSAAQCRPHTITALYEDDPWLTSPQRQPLSEESLDVLFKYGPVAYASRVFDSGEYNASVRNLMDRWPKISRELAEQEIHEFLTDGTGYLARTTKSSYEGPKEEDLKPKVGLGDKVLVVAWVIILVPAVSTLVSLSISASYTEPANQLSGSYGGLVL